MKIYFNNLPELTFSNNSIVVIGLYTTTYVREAIKVQKIFLTIYQRVLTFLIFPLLLSDSILPLKTMQPYKWEYFFVTI